MKKILSMFLALCMVVTMLPVTAMAEEAPVTIGTSREVISFAPLTETEKAVSLGTSIEDLELPEMLTATVRTAVPADENPAQDSGSPETATPTTAAEPEWEETTGDIPVRWVSEPEYAMDTEGVYVFTPVIEGYTVHAELPELTVTVGAAVMARGSAIPYGVATEIANYSDLQSAITAATGDLDLKLSDSYSGTGTIMIPSSCNHNITIDLNGKTLDGGANTAISHEGSGTLTIIDSAVGGMVTSRTAIGTIRAGNYSTVNIFGGTVNATGSSGYAIHSANTTLNISGGTVSATGSNSYAIYSPSEYAQLNISGGTISAVNGTAIFFPRTTIQNGTTAIIQGSTNAMTHTPTLVSGVQGAASNNYSGSPTTEYKAANLSTYKYLKFEPAAAVSYDVWVGSMRVTDANASDVLGDGKVSYTPAAGGIPQILTLNDVTIGAESQYSWNSTGLVTAYAAVYAKESLSLVLTGNNILTGVSQDTRDENSYGLYCGGALTVTGGGSLEATGAAMSEFNCSSYGLSVNGALSITDGATVTARGGNVSNGNSVSIGVFGSGVGGLIIDNATLTASAGKGYNSYGLRFKGDIRITNSTVIATSDEASYSSEAMGAYDGNIQISGGTVSAVGNRAITVPTGKSITISSGAAVTAKGNKGSSRSAMSQAPNLDAYGGEYHVTASSSYLGSDPTPYDSSSITDYRYLDIRQKTASPTAKTASASKSSAAQASVSFTLTNSPAYADGQAWKVYSSSTGTTLASGVTATNIGNTLTLAHATDIPAATYYVAVTESDKAESGRLALTVGAFVAPSLSGTATVSNTAPRIGDTLTASLVGGNNSGTLSYVWKADGTQVSTGESYTVTAADYDMVITLEITSSVEAGTVSSAPTTAVAKKAAPPAPSAPTLVLKTHSTVILTANGDYEFSKDGSEWQAATVFVGLNANTAYTFYQRVAETMDTEHSAASAGFSVTTDAATYSITADPTGKNFGSLAVGYTDPAAQTITIRNTGNSSVTLTQPTSTNYTIGTLSTTTLAANGTATFTVTPKAGLAVGNHDETLTVSTDYSTNATVELSFSVTAVPTYTVTFNPNGGTVSETSRSVAPGTAVGALPIPTRSGSYSFEGWYTAASGGTQISASTTVSANVTYYAHWIYTGGGGSGSSGGSSSNDNSSPVIVTPPAPDKPNSPTQGEIKVPGTVDSKGNVTVSLTDKTVTDAFDKAFAEAKKNGTEQNGITLVLRVDTGNKTGSNVTVNLPKAVQDTIIAKKIVNTIVVVDNPDIRVGMDLATVQEINKQAKSDVNITATRTDSGKLTGDAKKAIGSRPVFDLKVNYGNGKAVSSFGAGSVSVTIPYTLGANEKAGNVQAVYVDSNGKVHWLVNSVYDSAEKVLRFSTNHFSTYGIGYKQTNTAFTDITGHWAKEDIEFVVSRGLFSGTSTTTFSPNTAMTRGMFVTALGRLANADASSYTKSSFSDVKGDAYYMGYIEWASKNNIVNGVGNGKFAPDQSITREQMAVIMANYAKAIGYTLSKVHVENIFADNAKISTYAKEAVKQMQMVGIISGKNGNLYDPQGTATRAEVSAVLRRFVELAISSDTAQGWSMNDSGKWMYFKDGKPLTGKQDIDGATYTFDQYGVTADVPKNLRYTTYTVQKDDSFWSISRKLNCTMSELERLNNKSRFSLILPGDVLRVPEK